MAARTPVSATIVHIGTRWPERPTHLIDWIRAHCIAPRLITATATSHGTSQVAGSPHRLGIIIIAAIIFAAAKKPASWAREISCTSRSGDVSPSAPFAARPADSPPGSRAEIKRL
jgi:hypothetical protein